MAKFKLARDSGAIYVDKPVTDREMLTMALQGVKDVQQQVQQGLLDLRQHVKHEVGQLQLQPNTTAAGTATAGSAGLGGLAAAGNPHTGFVQQQTQPRVTEEQDLAQMLLQLQSGPDALSAADLAALQQQRDLLAAEAEAGAAPSPSTQPQVGFEKMLTHAFCQPARAGTSMHHACRVVCARQQAMKHQH